MKDRNPAFDEIEELGQKLLAIIDKNPELAMMLHIGERVTEDTINGFSVNAGQILLMTNALYIDLHEQIEDGQFDLFLELEDMMSVLRAELEERQNNDDSDFVESGYEKSTKNTTFH